MIIAAVCECVCVFFIIIITLKNRVIYNRLKLYCWFGRKRRKKHTRSVDDSIQSCTIAANHRITIWKEKLKKKHFFKVNNKSDDLDRHSPSSSSSSFELRKRTRGTNNKSISLSLWFNTLMQVKWRNSNALWTLKGWYISLFLLWHHRGVKYWFDTNFFFSIEFD